MFRLIQGYLRGYWSCYRPVELKTKIYGGGGGGREVNSVWNMSTSMVAWLRKIVSQDCLQRLEILVTYVVVDDVSFHHKSDFFKEMLTWVSKLPAH